MKKVALHNLGCKVNAYETEAMQEILEQNGYEIVPFEEKADAYIVNTCSVTNMADKKSRQMLHRAKKMNPEAVVIAAGCYVQSAGEELLKDTSVDILIGNNEKVNLPSILENWEKEHNPLHVHDLTREHTYEELTLSHTAGHTRAFMKIQDGCNQFCTYCIIPYTRGRTGQILHRVFRSPSDSAFSQESLLDILQFWQVKHLHLLLPSQMLLMYCHLLLQPRNL